MTFVHLWQFMQVFSGPKLWQSHKEGRASSSKEILRHWASGNWRHRAGFWSVSGWHYPPVHPDRERLFNDLLIPLPKKGSITVLPSSIWVVVSGQIVAPCPKLVFRCRIRIRFWFHCIRLDGRWRLIRWRLFGTTTLLLSTYSTISIHIRYTNQYRTNNRGNRVNTVLKQHLIRPIYSRNFGPQTPKLGHFLHLRCQPNCLTLSRCFFENIFSYFSRSLL